MSTSESKPRSSAIVWSPWISLRLLALHRGDGDAHRARRRVARRRGATSPGSCARASCVLRCASPSASRCAGAARRRGGRSTAACRTGASRSRRGAPCVRVPGASARSTDVVGLGHREAADALAAASAGDADDRELLDVRDLAEHALDVVGVDVLAGGRDDDVLDATDEHEAPAASSLPRSPVWSQPSSLFTSLAWPRRRCSPPSRSGRARGPRRRRARRASRS